jgi:hypothetical protein
MINQETKLPYAKFDHSDTRIRQAQHVHVPSWRGAWLWCLKHSDYQAAQLIFDHNKVSDECEDGDHEECHVSWCSCSHHSEVQFRAEHPQLRSLAESVSGQEELETVEVG